MPSRLDEIPAIWCHDRGDAVALHDARGSMTWRSLEAARRSLAARLADRGVRPGDRVMIVGENCAAMVALLFAVATLDAWIVNVNARLAPREVDAIRAHSRARCVVFPVDDSPDAASHAARLGAGLLADDGCGRILCCAIDASADPEPVAGAPGERVAALVYTTGTTGEPKGVMLSHSNLLFVARAGAQLRRLAPGDRVFAVLPLSHVYGLSSVCMGSALAGACIHLVPRFAPQVMETALATWAITLCQGVPAMYAKFLQHLAATGRQVRAPSLRAIYCGGSPLGAALKRDVERASRRWSAARWMATRR